MELTPAQLAAIECLMEKKTIVQAARCAGVARSTLNVWLRDPVFSAQFDSLKSATLSAMRRNVYTRLDDAWTVVGSALRADALPRDDYAGWQVRLKAAAMIIDAAANLARLDSSAQDAERAIKMIEDWTV